MSRRITNQIDVKDKTLAIAALKLDKSEYRDQGDSLLITSGALKNAMINLKTGEMVSDSDYGHTKLAVERFQQTYAEAKIREDAIKEGGLVQSRIVEGTDIRVRVAYG